MGAIGTHLLPQPLTFRERARRGGLLFLIGALHLIAILWLATRPPLAVTRPEAVVDLISIPGTSGGKPEPSAAPPPKAEAEIVSPVVIARSPIAAAPEVEAVADSSVAQGSGMATGGCALAQAVGDAILADAGAMAYLEALPPEARTEADAVMLWDGRWQVPDGPRVERRPPVASTANPAEMATPGALRGVIEQVIRDAQPECRDAPVLGPRFIALPTPSRTTMIVIGSGEWRWADLIQPTEPCVKSVGSPCISGSLRPGTLAISN